MQALGVVQHREKLETLVLLPSNFVRKGVRTSESFGMWKDRQDMEDVESYVRAMRKGRRIC